MTRDEKIGWICLIVSAVSVYFMIKAEPRDAWQLAGLERTTRTFAHEPSDKFAFYSLRGQWRAHHMVWRDVSGAPEFAKLSYWDKLDARAQYFDDVVAKQVPFGNYAAVKADFDSDSDDDLAPSWQWAWAKEYFMAAGAAPISLLMVLQLFFYLRDRVYAKYR